MSHTPVSVTLDQVQRGDISSSTLEEAFGPAALGILVVTDVGNGFEEARQEVLRSASRLAHLPMTELGKSRISYR